MWKLWGVHMQWGEVSRITLCFCAYWNIVYIPNLKLLCRCRLMTIYAAWSAKLNFFGGLSSKRFFYRLIKFYTHHFLSLSSLWVSTLKSATSRSTKVSNSELHHYLHVDVHSRCLNLEVTLGIMIGIDGPRRYPGFALMNGIFSYFYEIFMKFFKQKNVGFCKI